MTDQPPSPDANDADREACIKDLRHVMALGGFCSPEFVVDNTMRVLFERGRLRESAGEFEQLRLAWVASQSVNRVLRADLATLTRERDAALARANTAEEQCSMREQALDHLEGQRDAAIARANKLAEIVAANWNGAVSYAEVQQHREATAAALARAEKAEARLRRAIFIPLGDGSYTAEVEDVVADELQRGRERAEKAERERDEARAMLEQRSDEERASRQLASKFNIEAGRLTEERDAAIARAEKAERELMGVQEWARVWSARVDLVEVEAARLREALTSIANNACCGPCQEACLVARAALDAPADEKPEGR